MIGNVLSQVPVNMTVGPEYIQNLPELITRDMASNLLSLGVYSIGMVLYAIIIWHFYRNLAHRDTFNVNMWYRELKHPLLHSIRRFIVFMFKSLIVFPIISFVYFLILGAFLLFLSKDQPVETTLLTAMTVIAAARITAYYSEDLARDVSKMVPFALLGVFVVDPSFFTIEETIAKFMALPSYTHIVLQYLLTIVLLEFVLRVYYRLYERAIHKVPEQNI